jgi:hypothetical protein
MTRCPSNPSFTAARIAAALGSSCRVVRRALATVREEGRQLVRGNEAATFSVSSLPAAMLRKLERRANARGFRNAEHLLRAGAGRHESPVPVNQLAGPVQERAIKLRDALATPLVQHGEGLKGAALEELGLREYQRIFGFEISSRHWRGLFNRTIGRDAAEEQWNRLDLYLDDRPHVSRAPMAVRTSPALRDAEKILLGYASQVRNATQPTSDEKAILWKAAFDQTIGLVQEGMKLRAARHAMRLALWKCGVTLAKNETSLGQLWRVKEEASRNAQGSILVLKDRRGNSGNRRTPKITKNDLDIVIAYGVKFGGRVSQAWRYAVENNLLTPDVQSHYAGLCFASKSYVSRTIRDAVTAEIRLMRDMHHGPRTAKLNGAYITRDWTTVAAGDWYQADDVTLNNYYYAPDGKGGLSLMRGQVLLMIDVRSTCILGFAILDSRNYNAHAIRTLITRTCDDHGLPRKGFYFEGGIWKNSKLLKGDAGVSSDDLTWTESEGGLRELGLDFVHSRNPRSKPVERVIGQLQNLLDGQPGDAGRHEMKDGFERLQERKRLVESGQVPASQYFFSADQWTDRIIHFCEEYNTARNDGKMTRGLTPFKAWKNYQADPLVKLPDEARYLLAHHKRPVVVGRNGIRLQFGKQPFVYRNEETGKLRGQRVLAWFNPELPELLAVTDMNRENCFTVERSEDVPAMDAPEDVLQREMGRVADHNGYAQQRYRTLATLADLNARPTIMDHDTAKLGRDMTEQREYILVDRKARTKRVRAGRSAMNDLGLAPRRDEDFTPEQIEAAQRVRKELQQFSEENSK